MDYGLYVRRRRLLYLRKIRENFSLEISDLSIYVCGGFWSAYCNTLHIPVYSAQSFWLYLSAIYLPAQLIIPLNSSQRDGRLCMTGC